MSKRKVTLHELRGLVANYNVFFESLKEAFVNRERIIDLMKYATAQRHHLLVFGPPGTSKTAISDMAMAGITGAKTFQIELSMFMTEDNVFGPYDPKKMREDGLLFHNTENMLPEANVARFGEFLDPNMALLRSLLGVLNERQLRRGRQILKIPLYTVYCDTNKDPYEILKNSPYLWAVLDRILFMAKVNYISTSEDMSEMCRRFQTGQTTRLKKTLSLETIDRISELIVMPPSLITNQLMYLKMGEAFMDYRRQRKQQIESNGKDVILPEISDRRFANATQMCEVNAVLNGRMECIPEDMESIHFAIGTTDWEKELWLNIYNQRKEELKELMSQQVDHAQMVALEAIEKEIDNIDLNSMNDVDKLQEAMHSLSVIKQQLDPIRPENDDVDKKKDEWANKINSIANTTTEALKEQLSLSA